MTTYQTSIVAGVFRDSGPAQQAVDALRNAGFKYDQVGVAMRTAPNATPNLHDDLMKLGVPEEMASFYEQEYQAGYIVVSIRPDGRDAEARDVLRQYGAYDYSASMGPAEQQNLAQAGQPAPENRPDVTRERTTGEPSIYGQPSEQAKRQPQTESEESERPGWHPAMGNQPPQQDQRPLS